MVWGHGLCQEKSLNPSEPGPGCWTVGSYTGYNIIHEEGGGGASIIQHVGKPVTRERGAGAGPCLGKIPITHIHVPGLINFIIPNPSAMIESLRTNPASKQSNLRAPPVYLFTIGQRAQVMFCSCKYFCEDQTLGRLMFPISL